jgi:F-type H+-transporting ATPase subunit epsilon/F-type H+-transporting ATPase subunit delta
MSEYFVVEIISPDKSILKSETTEVTIPSYEGQMGVLKDHIALITFLRPGLVTVKKDSGEEIFFLEEGTVEFKNNNLLILSSTVKNINKLDKISIDTILKDCSEKMKNEEVTDKEKYLIAHKIDTLSEIN